MFVMIFKRVFMRIFPIESDPRCLYIVAWASSRNLRPNLFYNTSVQYLAPEIMRILSHDLYEDNVNISATKASNAFAFGTILYELLTAEWPWRDQPAESVIWLVGTGMLPSLADINASGTLFSHVVRFTTLM